MGLCEFVVLCADSRFAEPRSSLLEGFNFVRAKPSLRRAESRFAKPRFFFWEGFNFVSGKLLFWGTDSRFAKPRIFLKKVLIVAVQICCCGALIRGLQNLGAPSKRERFFVLFACTKRTKSTPEVCEPLDSGDDSNLRSIRDFGGNDRRSSCHWPSREFQPFRVSTVRI